MSWDVPSEDPRFGLGYALAAYGIFIVAFFVYVYTVHVRCERLRRRLELVEKRVDEAGASRRG